MEKIAHDNTDNEALPRAIEHFYIGEPPKLEVKRGRPRKFATDEERKQHYKDSHYKLKYYYKKLRVPYTCDICNRTCSSMSALTAHKNKNKNAQRFKKQRIFLNSEQHEKLKQVIYKNKVT